MKFWENWRTSPTETENVPNPEKRRLFRRLGDFLDEESTRIDSELIISEMENSPSPAKEEDKIATQGFSRRDFLRAATALLTALAGKELFLSREASAALEKVSLENQVDEKVEIKIAQYRREAEKYYQQHACEMESYARRIDLEKIFARANELLRQNRGVMSGISARLKMDLAMIYSIIAVESGWKQDAKNGDNYGLMQVQEATAREVAEKVGILGRLHTRFNPRDPYSLYNFQTNVLLGMTRFRQMLERAEGDVGKAAMYYNQGPYYDSPYRKNPERIEESIRKAREYEFKFKTVLFYFFNQDKIPSQKTSQCSH